MKMNLIRLLLPYFPNTSFLKKQWRHRLVKVIAIITSILLNIIALTILVQTLIDFLPCTIAQKITVEEFGKQLKEKHIEDFIPGEDFKPQLPAPVRNSVRWEAYGKLTVYDRFSDLDAGNIRLKNNPVDKDKIIGYNCFNKLSPFLITVMVVSSLLGLFFINLLYRVVLYIILNNWNK